MTLDDAPSEEERASAQLVLSNPMDLTYASELISVGLMPRPSEMVGQGIRSWPEASPHVEKRQFPTALFAKHVVELRMADRNWLDPGEFANEQPALEDYRLLVRTVIRNQEGQEESRPRFRHDKVVDFFSSSPSTMTPRYRSRISTTRASAVCIFSMPRRQRWTLPVVCATSSYCAQPRRAIMR